MGQHHGEEVSTSVAGDAEPSGLEEAHGLKHGKGQNASGLTAGVHVLEQPAGLTTAACTAVAGTPDHNAGPTSQECDSTQLHSLHTSSAPNAIDAEREMLDIVTPVKVDRLDYWLEGYDERVKSYLLDGFRHGFSLKCNHNPSAGSPNDQTGNHKSATDQPDVVRKLLSKEVAANRIAGPFDKKPYSDLHVSPLSIRPKKEANKFRLIHDLSFPQNCSVNSGISKEDSSVEYENLDKAIEYIQQVGPGAFLAKTDIKGAFRIIPVKPEDRLLLGMAWDNNFYFDKCLAMGCRTSCKIFETFSKALQWICKEKLGIEIMVHVLDDFLFIHKLQAGCQDALSKFQALCEDLGIPLAPDKTIGPLQILIFLGIELDTINFFSRLPEDKVKKCRQEIVQLLSTKVKSVRLKQLQSVIGLLNFACRVVIPGRAFLRRLIDRTCGVASKFHFVRITNEDKADLRMWIKFLAKFNGQCLFQQAGWAESPDLHLYTDASKLGYGAILNAKWVAGEFPLAWQENNITVLELYPIVLALSIWKDWLSNKKLRIHTDNQDLVHVINKKSSREKSIMPLIRKLVLTTLKNNTLVHAVHIPGASNCLADALSRLQLEKFKRLAPHMEDQPSVVPNHLLPQAIVNI